SASGPTISTLTFGGSSSTGRTAGEFVMICRRGGKEVFRDVKPCVILAPLPGLPQLGANGLIVYDPKGKVQPWLKRHGYPFREATSLDELPPKVSVLIVGPDALTARQATDPRWVA